MPAAASKRVLWKGAIAFGLVHIPIALHSATQNQSIDFDWLDRRSMEPVGYKRVNKVTGKEIDRADIVKGIAYEEGEYVVLEPEEISAAYPRTTQTVEIEAFVSLDAIPFVYLERPYYVAPINKGGKVYALLREVLAESRMAGLAKVVIQTKQHLALLFACGPVLILNLLRWGDEVRDWSALNLTEMLQRSLKGRPTTKTGSSAPARAAKKSTSRRSTKSAAKKTASKTTASKTSGKTAARKTTARKKQAA